VIKQILKIVSKNGATKCHILRLTCTKFNLCWSSAPYLVGGPYSTTPDIQQILDVFKRAQYLEKRKKRRKKNDRKKWAKRGKKEERREKREGKGR